MRKIFFYFFIFKKVILLLIYPLFEKKGKFFITVRKNIENYLIFQPSKLRAKRIQRGLLKKINPLRFINSEGIKLYAWFIKPKNKMPVILHLHGQAESILSHQDIALYCLEKGFGLFMLSYRGHYKSSGKASEQGVYNDAQDAILQLKKLGVDKDKIILWGHSLGTVVTLETALNNNILGVILQSPIKEIKSAASDISYFYYKRLHLDLLAFFIKKHIEKIDFIQKIDNLSRIGKVECPILILHSKFDKITPCQNALELAEINTNALLYISESGNHWDATWCFDKVFEFINSLEYNRREKVKGKSER
ncbi:MAG: alpha/beta fold hydrolase [Candidatus Gastranaerophilales bacterium]|nr:alpha/beta fold hydrolase [Candidatus Gastranaerophilales bacterium]